MITFNNGKLTKDWNNKNKDYYLEQCPKDWVVSIAHYFLQDTKNNDFVICSRCKLQILVNGPEWDNIMECYPHYESNTSGY